MNREGDWMCAACQYTNFKRRDACQKCGCPKFASAADIATYRTINRTEVLPGDWYCTGMNCGAHNYASRNNCYRCGASKGGDYGGYVPGMIPPPAYLCDPSVIPGWKTGDWICTRYGCGEHNYASRLECHKCKSLRDFCKSRF
ncbi:OLC1v1037140C1 [Oldenlandia corymbosa var. corymbosa]|uniref:OLC1v1037140C1 n=2 Tax=Oldenlandia corymbosa var. corymbosa TaxID=529605 RepID=A0AAV1D0N2_OLDCO|nr:OLC1v1037140C1 [Oldenlandia corymbosa var. corymbosa]